MEGLLIILNTGAVMWKGLAIGEMIDTYPNRRFHWFSGRHSIGVPAVSADHSFISETATMTIHPIRLSGFNRCARHLEYLDKMQDRLFALW